MKKGLRILGIAICLVLLILVRKTETVIFYDPLLAFFKQTGFTHNPVPEINMLKMFLSLLLRFGLNSVLTAVIIQLWFLDKKITRLSVYILSAGFVFFGLLYFVSLCTDFSLGYMPTFYIRRILIQPIMLLLLIPAVYYYKNLKN